VTADGSIDCANEPGEQEIKVASLVYAEAVSALSLLQRCGSLVLKMFTLFEHTSICLLYLLSCTFEQVCLAFHHRSILRIFYDKQEQKVIQRWLFGNDNQNWRMCREKRNVAKCNDNKKGVQNHSC